jgi:hypothetical protein
MIMDEPISWFRQFVLDHVARNPHHGFPRFNKADTTAAGEIQNKAFAVYFAAWKKAFLARKVTEAEARAASEAMAEKGSVFPDEHLAVLLHGIARARQEATERAQAEVRRKRAELHLKELAEREAMREIWDQLTDRERDRIRSLVVADYATPPPERFVQMLCVERLREIREEGEGR